MPKRYIPNDSWSQKAAKEGYRARSVYKLMELDEKFHLIKPGMTVLDLGAAPGSWLQYVSGKMREERGESTGRIIGIDLQEIEPIEEVETYVADITNKEAINQILSNEANEAIKADLILSDLAPSTSGIKDIDQWRSIELSHAVVDIARRYLKPSGRVVMKVLRGGDFDVFLKDLKRECSDVKTFQAAASRDRSKEVYVIVTL